MGILRTIGENKRKNEQKAKQNDGNFLGYVGTSALAGIGSTVEGVADLLAAGGYMLMGDKDGAKQQFKDNVVGDWYQRERESYNPSGVTGFVGDVAHGVGQSTVFLLDAVAPGVGTGLFFSGAVGGGISSAAEKTGDVGWRELGYGVASGVTEGVLEKLSGGGAKAAKSIGAALAKKTGKSFSTAISKQAGKTLGKTVLKETVGGMLGEFVEESASEILDPQLQRLFNIDENASTSLKDVLYAGLVGAVSGGIMTGPASAINYKSASRAGRSIREAGETEAVLNRAKATVDVLKRVVTKAEAEGSAEATLTDDASGLAKAVAKGKQKHENSKTRKVGRRTAALADKLERNIKGYESLDEAVRNSEAGDAVLGELRGNLYYTNLAYAIEEEADELLKYTAEQQQAIVDYINREAVKKEGQRADYTVEDFTADVDGIRTQFAALEIGEVVINGVPTEDEADVSDNDGAVETAETVKTAETAQGSRTRPVYTITEDMSADQIMDAVADSWGFGEVERHMMHDTYTESSALSPENFAGGFAEGVLFGRHNIDLKHMEAGGRLATMSERERAAAIEAGRIVRAQEQAARDKEAAQKKAPAESAADRSQVRKRGSEYVHVDKDVAMRSLSDRQYTAVKAAGVIGEALGVHIYFHKTLGGDKGYYDVDTGNIHIALDAGVDGQSVALFTLAHEVTHHIYEWSPQKFEVLSDFCMKKLGKDAKRMIDEKLDQLDENGLLEGMTYREAVELAREEVVADAMESVLSDGEVLGELAVQDATLWEKVKAWLDAAIAKIRAAYEGLKPDSNAGRAMAEVLAEDGALAEMERLFTEGVQDAGERRRAAEVDTAESRTGGNLKYDNTQSEKSSKKFSFAGQAAETANRMALATAMQMEKDGKSSEDIRRETGWFRGMERKWRFEISDFDSHMIENPQLEQHEDNGDVYYTGKLSDVLAHDELYRAYPFLRRYTVIIQSTNPNTRGSFHARERQIVLSRELFERRSKAYDAEMERRKERIREIEQTAAYKEYNRFFEDEGNEALEAVGAEEWLRQEKEAQDKFFSSELGKEYYQLQWGGVKGIPKKELGWSDRARSVLLHEVQHAVQAVENFEGGSSETYWDRRMTEKYRNDYSEARVGFKRLYNGASDELKAALDSLDDTVNHFDTNERKIAQAYDKAANLIEDEDALEDLWRFAEAATRLNDYYQRRGLITGDLYRKTAGEIEARDTSARADLTAEQRKNTRPDIDRTDVVFAEDTILSLAVGEKGESKALIKAINENLQNISPTEKYDVTASETVEGKKSEYISNIFDLQGNRAENPVLGTVELIKKGAESTIFHGFGGKKLVAALAIKDVIEKGDIISETKNYEGRQIDRYIIAAKGKINGEESYTAVVVESYQSQNNKKQFYLHETVIVKTGSHIMTATQNNADTVSEPVSKDSISQKPSGVNTQTKKSLKFSLGTDGERSTLQREPSAAELAAVEDIRSVEEFLAREFETEEMGGRWSLSIKQGTRRAILKRLTNLYENADRKAVADEIAEMMIDSAALDFTDDGAGDTGAQRIEVLGDYLHKLDLSNIQDDIRATYDDLSGAVLKRWHKAGGMRVDAVADEIRERLGEDIPFDKPADILAWVEDTYTSEVEIKRKRKAFILQELKGSGLYLPLRGEISKNLQESMNRAAYDRAATNIESYYKEAYNDAMRRAEAELKDEKKRLRALAKEQREATGAQLREYSRQKEEYRSERRETVTRQAQARRIMARLNTMLFSPTKVKHLPIGMQRVVEEILGAADIGAFGQIRTHMAKLAGLELEIGKLEAIPAEARTVAQNKRLEAKRDKRDEMATEQYTAHEQARHLLDIYKAFGESKDPLTRAAYDADIAKTLEDNLKAIEDKPLASMSIESLRAVEKLFGVIYRSAVNTNRLFTEENSARLSDMGDAGIKEVEAAKAPKLMRNKPLSLQTADDVRAFFWRNMKPLTVFNLIGSDTFKGLFIKVLDGEGVWARDVEEARDFIKEAKKKHGYDGWDLETRTEVKDKEGKTVKLTLGEIMSLYAYSFRAQAVNHLAGGGFKLDPAAVQKATIKGRETSLIKQKLNDAERYTLDEKIMGDIAKKLTPEQKQFVEEVQRYLSDVMGEKGNEVSRKLWGLELFREEYYFPIKVASEYLDSQTGKTGDPKIKNKGMAHETVPDAENPLVLQDFMTVVCGHVNDMAAYHAFVLPVEDLTRVLNYQPTNAKIDEDGNWSVAEDADTKTYSSMKSVIESKYGDVAVNYIEQLIRDLNGGARRELATGIIDKGLTAFKRASTLASLSVLIQQPTSIFRAMAYIDPKYLFTTAGFSKGKHPERWERVKKYAPIAIIKEMGGYDTGVGKRTADYINSPEYDGFMEKAKAFFKDSEYRGEILGKGAALADEITWVQIFEACVQEQADKMGKPDTDEAVLVAAGERFTEVIRSTQVYDSTLARSQFMRSKDTGMKMLTAFMAEPTTVVSMIIDAIVAGERGDKKFVRTTVAGVLASVIVNAIAVSLVYAMRDDDEEKTYEEKLIANVVAETAEGINPLEYLPFARDIMSLVKGYEVERSDMSLFAALIQSAQRLASGSRSPYDKVVGVAGSAGAFFGLPIKNIERDAKGLILTTAGIFKGSSEKTTATGVGQAISEEFGYITKLFGADYSNAYELYRSVMDGDTAHYERVLARYDTESDAEMALRKMLRDSDPRIAEAAEARYNGEPEVYVSLVDQIEAEGRFDRNMIIRAINNELNRIKETADQVTVPVDEDAVAAEAEEADEAEALYSSFDLNQAIASGDAEDMAVIIEEMIADRVSRGKTEAQARAAIKSSVTSYWKKLYVEAWRNGDNEERKRIIALLTDTGLYGTRNDVAKKATGWVQAANK